MLNLVFIEPEIPQNTGTLLRTATAFGIPFHLVRPLGFVLNNKALQRAHMDYGDFSGIHDSWEAFFAFHKKQKGRLIALTPEARLSLYDFTFFPHDWILLGTESMGLRKGVKEHCHAKISIPMCSAARSLNVAIAGAITLSEGMRQLSL